VIINRTLMIVNQLNLIFSFWNICFWL